MSAMQLDLTIEQGATFRHRLIWQDSEGTRIPLTGCTVTMQAREQAADPTLLLELTVANGRITLDAGDAGDIDLKISADDTGGISWIQAVYDVKLTDPDGLAWRLAEGEINVKPAVTR